MWRLSCPTAQADPHAGGPRRVRAHGMFKAMRTAEERGRYGFAASSPASGHCRSIAPCPSSRRPTPRPTPAFSSSTPRSPVASCASTVATRSPWRSSPRIRPCARGRATARPLRPLRTDWPTLRTPHLPVAHTLASRAQEASRADTGEGPWACAARLLPRHQGHPIPVRTAASVERLRRRRGLRFGACASCSHSVGFGRRPGHEARARLVAPDRLGRRRPPNQARAHASPWRMGNAPPMGTKPTRSPIRSLARPVGISQARLVPVPEAGRHDVAVIACARPRRRSRSRTPMPASSRRPAAGTVRPPTPAGSAATLCNRASAFRQATARSLRRGRRHGAGVSGPSPAGPWRRPAGGRRHGRPRRSSVARSPGPARPRPSGFRRDGSCGG